MNVKCKWPMGEIVGGTSRLNNMIYLRGDTQQYVDWFHGKYSYEYVEQKFSEIKSKYLKVSEIRYHTELLNATLDACQELRLPVGDLNSKISQGCMPTQVNQDNGKRWYIFSTLFNIFNELFRVITNANVNKIIFDKDGRAIGVEYSSFKHTKDIYARKGVILSAGVIGTPKILLLSGIGPKKHLQSLGLNVVKDLPVGLNLQDHITTGLDLILLNKSLSLNTATLLNPLHGLNYLIKGQGAWTSPGCEVVALLNTEANNTIQNKSKSDLQLMVMPVGLTSDKGISLRYSVGISDSTWDEYFASLVHKQTITILPILLHPRSRGYVELSSLDPKAKPIINPRYLTEQEDIDLIVKGLLKVKEFIQSEAMQSLGAKVNQQHFPGCNYLQFDSTQYWECYVRHLTLTSFHPVGTCKMDYEDNVVNTNFTVKGFDNLYVVDASIFPTIPGSNINSAVALVASIFVDNVILSETKVLIHSCDNRTFDSVIFSLSHCLFKFQ